MKKNEKNFIVDDIELEHAFLTFLISRQQKMFGFDVLHFQGRLNIIDFTTFESKRRQKEPQNYIKGSTFNFYYYIFSNNIFSFIVYKHWSKPSRSKKSFWGLLWFSFT